MRIENQLQKVKLSKYKNQKYKIICDDKCRDIVLRVIENCRSEDCIPLIAVVSVGWIVVATSVVGVGNTVYWIEKQGLVKKVQ